MTTKDFNKIVRYAFKVYWASRKDQDVLDAIREFGLSEEEEQEVLGAVHAMAEHKEYEDSKFSWKTIVYTFFILVIVFRFLYRIMPYLKSL